LIFFFVGELPEAKYELSEDIDPPGEKCPRKFSLETLRWVFAPVAVSSFEGAPWPFLGSVAGAQKGKPSLDTLSRILQRLSSVNSTED
jgi:hypothetical protein